MQSSVSMERGKNNVITQAIAPNVHTIEHGDDWQLDWILESLFDEQNLLDTYQDLYC